jgi:hypothetical protein
VFSHRVAQLVSGGRKKHENSFIVEHRITHRNNPLRFFHVTQRVGGSSKSDLCTDGNIQQQKFSLGQVKQHLPNLTEEALARFPDEHLLFFWTDSAFFTVAQAKNSRPSTSIIDYSSQPRPSVQDNSGNDVGFACKIGYQNRSDFVGSGEDCPKEFVAVGRRQVPGIPEILGEEICPPRVLTLQIERDEYGVSVGVKFAEIDLKTWINAEPKVTLIALR